MVPDRRCSRPHSRATIVTETRFFFTIAIHRDAKDAQRSMSDHCCKGHTSGSGYDGCVLDEDLFSDSRSFAHPVETTTRVPRKAGKFIPRARQNQKFPPLLCVRQGITAWFKEKGVVEEGWIGMGACPLKNAVLMGFRDIAGRPPFQAS
jgi:hypothetical protein